MAISEDEKQKAIERANAYREMMGMWAWKDFWSLCETQQQNALNEFKAMDNPTFFQVGETKGRMAAIDKIEHEIAYILNAQ